MSPEKVQAETGLPPCGGPRRRVYYRYCITLPRLAAVAAAMMMSLTCLAVSCCSLPFEPCAATYPGEKQEHAVALENVAFENVYDTTLYLHDYDLGMSERYTGEGHQCGAIAIGQQGFFPSRMASIHGTKMDANWYKHEHMPHENLDLDEKEIYVEYLDLWQCVSLDLAVLRVPVRRRLKANKRYLVGYNPGKSLDGHCTYAVLQILLTGKKPTRRAVMELRSSLVLAYRSRAELLHAAASQEQVSPAHYIRKFVRAGWGGYPEIALCAEIAQMHIVITDGRRIIASAGARRSTPHVLLLQP